MEIKKVYVIVDKDKDRELINKLCRIAFKSQWEINEWARSSNLSKFTNEEMKKMIEEYGSYNARVLVFTNHSRRGVLEITFLRFHPVDRPFLSRINDGHDETKLKSVIDWIKTQKNFLGLNKKVKKD